MLNNNNCTNTTDAVPDDYAGSNDEDHRREIQIKAKNHR